MERVQVYMHTHLRMSHVNNVSANNDAWSGIASCC